VASGSPEQLTLTSSSGAGNGSSVGVDARLNGTSGPQLALLRTAAYDLTTKSLAFRVVHLAGVSSSTQSYTASQLDDYLEEIYAAAVTQFTSVTQLADMSVNYDLNHDGYLDTSYWRTAEMNVIINNCDQSGYDHIIFLVDNGSHSSGGGFMDLGQKWGFIHGNQIAQAGVNPFQVTAHELGHGAFELKHATTSVSGRPYNDALNLMWPEAGSTRIHLRKDQWHEIHGLGQ
jgi:hypothetical protein